MQINQEASVVQHAEIIIHAKPANVWSVLVNINQWDKWNERIKKPKLSTEIGEGCTFTWKTGGSSIRSRVHSYEPYAFLGWTGKTIGARAIHNWYLKPHEEGCLLHVEESMEGWLVATMKKKLNKILADDMRFWIEQLKKECEKEPKTTA